MPKEKSDPELFAVGQRFAKERNRLKMSQTEFAKQVGASQPQISKLETGKRGLRSLTLLRALQFLGRSGSSIGDILLGPANDLEQHMSVMFGAKFTSDFFKFVEAQRRALPEASDVVGESDRPSERGRKS